MNKLYRNTKLSLVEGRIIEGYAVVFNSWSVDLGGFREIIRPLAITQDIINSSDVIANMDHDDNYMMARSKFGKGNLELILDEKGVKFRFDCPETAKGEELLQHVKRGEIDECSFAFTIDEADETALRWFYEGEQLCREILKINQLFDISCVKNAAYPDTSCSARDREQAEKIEKSRKHLLIYDEMLDDLS